VLDRLGRVLDPCIILMFATVALAALFITWIIGRRILRFSVEDEVVLPPMIFHQLQLIVCAVLARRYAARPEAMATDQASALAQPSL
jgi:hypothetical protein